MATSTSTAAAPSPDAFESRSPIDNELPTYRAISPLAVASLTFGVISALSFTSWAWLVASGLAVVMGLLSLRKIAKRPDILTGRSLAQAGLAMGLVFGVSAVSYTLWSTFVLYADAREFGLTLNKSLSSAQQTTPLDTSDFVWYMVPGEMRRGLTPEDAKAQLAGVLKSSEKVKAIDDSIRAMIEHAKGKPIEFVQIEEATSFKTDVYATGLFRIGNGQVDEHKHEEGEVHDEKKEVGLNSALISMKGVGPRSTQNRWFVENITYPYVPNSYVIQEPAKAADDHGHGH